MAVRYAVLQKIEGNDSVPRECFINLCRGLLLALEEQGRLTVDQYRLAEERLLRQSSGSPKDR